MGMSGISDYWLFCGAVLMLNATPGPDTAFIVGRSIAQGQRAGVVSALGISAGCCVHVLASAFGLGALLAASATAFLTIKLVGAAYLIYLGLRMILTRAYGPEAQVDARETAGAAHSSATLFRQAMLTNLLNPKVVLFFLAFFPQFVRPQALDKISAMLWLGLTFLVISTCWGCATALIAATLARRLRRAGSLRIWLERGVGAAFIALGARIALARN